MFDNAPDDLPKFKKPPVVEVALSVQFAELPGFGNVHLGLLWNRYRDQYPRVEEHLPLADVEEKFEPQQRDIGVIIEAVDQPPFPRLWFMNNPGTRLIQVQRSRFIHNWRKADTEEPYPHYPDIREQFLAAYRNFEKFLEDESIGHPSIRQCEITYVNHIDASGPLGHDQSAPRSSQAFTKGGRRDERRVVAGDCVRN